MPFSVLMSLYGREQPVFLDHALCSVFEQTLPPSEVILVLDGAISPPLQAVVDKYKEKYPQALKVIALPQNIGLGPALNEGLKYCAHELVARMDTDDICKPHRFEKQIACLVQNPNIDAMSTWVEEFYDTPDNIVSIRRLPQSHCELRRYARRRSPLNHPAVMFKKSRVIASGGYELLGFLDDYVLWMKMLQNGCQFYNVQESLLYFRSNADMFKRRGGWRYAVSECRLQWQFYQRGMIALPTAIVNMCLRFGVRIAPNALRRFVYQSVLRHSPPPSLQLIDYAVVNIRWTHQQRQYLTEPFIRQAMSDEGFLASASYYNPHKQYRHAA